MGRSSGPKTKRGAKMKDATGKELKKETKDQKLCVDLDQRTRLQVFSFLSIRKSIDVTRQQQK